MVSHVKLEIAIQIITEKIADIYNKLDSAKNEYEVELYNQELNEAFNEKELIFKGNMRAIDFVLNTNKGVK